VKAYDSYESYAPRPQKSYAARPLGGVTKSLHRVPMHAHLLTSGRER
jgi:hypothetical protein